MAITVLEDYHLLGKRIVYSILRASGYEVLDYRQTDVNGLIQQVKKDDVKILFLMMIYGRKWGRMLWQKVLLNLSP